MSAVAFDTLKLARKLRDTAHMSQEQAEGIADALAEAMSGAELATRSDIRELAAATKHDLAELQSASKADLLRETAALRSDLEAAQHRLEAKITDAKADTIKWLFGAIAAQTAFLVSIGTVLAKLLGH